MRERARDRQQPGLRSPLVPIVFTIAALTWPLSSFASEQESPILDYTLTRVFGDESMSIHGASLSPDGRWIAFAEGDLATRQNLWLVSTEGGEPIPLTKGPYIDDRPVWFPSSDRIAFGSTRAPIWALMTLPLDTLTGRPAGPLRQVTLGDMSNYYDVSPDGKWIVYSSSGDPGPAIRIIPATGGIARTIADPGGLVPMWSPDGRSIYYVTSGTHSSESVLEKVPVAGGRPETVLTWPSRMLTLLSGPNRHFIKRGPLEGSGVEIATLEGRSVGRVSLITNRTAILGISREGDRILATSEDRNSVVMILPVKGGPGHQLKETRGYDEPFGWSEDGTRVLFETEMDDEVVMLYAPVAGGPMHQVKLPERRMWRFTPVLSGDGMYVLYAVKEDESELDTLEVYSIEEDWSWELSREFFRDPAGQMRLSGRGGTHYRDGDDFLYFEKREGHYVLVASSPQGPARVMRTFADELPTSIGVHGNRIAYIQNSGNEATLFLAMAGKQTARQLLRLQGMLDMVVWSPAGRRMIAHHFDPTRSSGKDWDPAGRDLIALDLKPSGEVDGVPSRYVVPPGGWWNPRWLPDGQAVLVNAMDGNIWLIPLDPSARPVALTQDDPNGAWGRFRLSPDGLHIAYPSEKNRGSSIWLLKLKEPLTNDDD